MGSELNRVMQKYSVPNQGMAQTLGAMGRYGDSLVAHITPEEAMMLKRQGGAGTINPLTGLLEFYDSDGSGNASDSGNPTGGDTGGGGGDNGGWGGGDWGANVDFGGPMGGTMGGGFAGDNAQSGMANVFGNSTFGGGFAGDNAQSGMANVSGDSVASTTSDNSGGYNNAGGNDYFVTDSGLTTAPTNTPTTTTTPATTAPTTNTTTPTSNFQFAPYSAPASYGFELDRLMRQYGVSTPTRMPFAGYNAADDVRRAEYDKNVYQNYADQFNNRLAQTNMYNRAQFMPDPTKFTPQYSTPVANPTYAPANYGGIYNTYTKYFGRAPEEAGVQYWGKMGATGDALRDAILRGAQNSDLDYLRSQYPDLAPAPAPAPTPPAPQPGGDGYAYHGGDLWNRLPPLEQPGGGGGPLFARGGAVKTRYAEGGEVEEPETERSNRGPLTPEGAARMAALLDQMRPTTNYGAQLAGAQQAARGETEAFSNMIRQMSERAESPTSRAEMYFRLASAFGAPTRTGQFTENLGLAGQQMGEYARGRRTDEAERRALALRAQELRMAGARQDLASLQTLAGQEAAAQRAINLRMIDAQARAGAPNARETRINDTMQTFNVDRPTAVRIVDNIIVAVPGSAGEPPTFFDRSTNEIVVPGGVRRPAPNEPRETPTPQPAAAPTEAEAPAVNLRRPQAAAATAPATAAAPTSVEDFYAGRRRREVEQAEQMSGAQARGQAVVRREEQPARVEEAGQTAEAQARGRATVETETEERKRQRGQTNVESILRDMAASYLRLNELGGIPGESRTTLQNLPAYLAGTGAGQEVGMALATQSQTQRNQIQASVRQLLTAIKNATGMSAQEMNSNVELQSLMAAVSNPRQSIESVRGILASISRQYGLGELDFPEPTAPPAAVPREQTQGSRRRGAAANATPTLEQFLAAARRANPNVSDEVLTDYYNRTYGGR